MRKAVALILAAAFVAALPSMASAKKRHHRHRAVAAQVAPQGSGNFVFDALHQIFVPLEVTLGGPRTY
jgi:hypothetical protein